MVLTTLLTNFLTFTFKYINALQAVEKMFKGLAELIAMERELEETQAQDQPLPDAEEPAPPEQQHEVPEEEHHGD
jgi:hypothetical protein